MSVAVHVVRYLKTPLTAAELDALAGRLEDPVEGLVRNDSFFKTLGLAHESLGGDRAAVVALLAAHPRLLQRPILDNGRRAIIGRPKDRVAPFLAEAG